MSHTKGPWKFNMLGGGKGGPNQWSVRADCPQSDLAEFAIAVVHGKETHYEAYDNARLITAAPDMLETLKIVLEYLDKKGGDTGGLRGLVSARIAIAAGEE